MKIKGIRNNTVDKNENGRNVFLSPPGKDAALFFDALAAISNAAVDDPDLLCAMEEATFWDQVK
jgi:hypothetical protein